MNMRLELKKRKKLFIFILFIIVILIVNIKTITNDFLNVTNDGVMYYFSKDYFIESIKAGFFPLWNPYSSVGTPFLADVQQSVFSPFNILYFLFDTPLAFNIFRVVQLVIAGFFMYLFIEEITNESMISLMIGLFFSFSTMLGGSRIEHNTIITTIAFFPVVFYFLEKYKNTNEIKWLILSSISMMIQFVSGFTQIVLYFNLAAFVYLIYIFYDCKIKFKEAIKLLAIWGSIYLLLAGVQLIPTLQLMLQSGRNSIPWETFSVLAYDLRILLMMIFPGIYENKFEAFGDYASSGIDIEIYIGIICLIYIIYSLLYCYKDRKVKVVAGIMIGAFLYGMSPHIPLLGKLIYKIPILNSFRVSARSLPIFIFCAYILCGIGMVSGLKKENLNKLIRINVIIITLIVTNFVVIAAVFSQKIFSGLGSQNDYFSSLGKGILLNLILCCLNFLFLMIIKGIKKQKFMSIVLICMCVVTVLDVSRFSLTYFKNQISIKTLNDDGLDENSRQLMNRNTEEGYRSFIAMDNPVDFNASDELNIAKYGRSMHNQQNVYNSWLTFLDKKLGYWGIKETVYYPQFIKNLSDHNNLISMLGIHYIFDAWNHEINTLSPDNKDKGDVEFGIADIKLPGSDSVSVYSHQIDWLEPNSCYKITLDLDTQLVPDVFYVDFYGNTYDNIKQDGNFLNNKSGHKETYIFTDEIPNEQIYFRIVGVGSADFNIKNLNISKVKTHTVLEKLDSTGPIDIYKNINARKLIYVPEKVIPIDEYGETWEDDGLDEVDKVSYVQGFDKVMDLKNANTKVYNIDEDRNSVKASVVALNETFINHAQLSYPGWKVYIDGKREKLYTVNNLIQGVLVPAGEHTVEFKFDPFDFKLGFIIMLLGVGEVIIVLMYKRRRKS